MVYALLGIGVWLGVLGSGVHVTVAGVLVAVFIPAKAKYDTDTFIKKIQVYLDRFECEPGSCGYTVLLNNKHMDAVQAIEETCYHVATPLQRLEHGLQSWVTLIILALFALANAGLLLKGTDLSRAFFEPVTLGIMTGLVLEKPVGISGFTYAGYKIFNASLPSGVSWRHIIGVCMLGGIGFTMSLFISGLSFEASDLAELSKLGIITGSVISAMLGLIVLGLGDKLK